MKHIFTMLIVCVLAMITLLAFVNHDVINGNLSVIGDINVASSPLRSTPKAGTLEFYNGKLYATFLATQRVLDRTSDVLLSTVEVSNTTTETTVYTGVIGANALVTGNILKLHCNGVLSNNSASDDVIIKIYLAETEVLSFSPAIGNVSDAYWYMNGEMTVRASGETGEIAFHLETRIDNSTNEESGIIMPIDTTVVQDYTLTVTWDNAKEDNILSIYQGYTEWKN